MSNYSGFSDLELVNLLKIGNQEAFAEIYRRHWANLIDSAYKRLKSIETAEEIVQEVFLNLYAKRQSLVITTTLAAYLNGVLKYKVLDEIRARVVRNQYREEWLHRPEIYSDDVHELLESKELSILIFELTEQLPKKCKEVFLLKYKDHLSNKMIAEKLHVAEKTVEGHISVARKILKQQLSTYRSDLIAVLICLSLLG